MGTSTQPSARTSTVNSNFMDASSWPTLPVKRAVETRYGMGTPRAPAGAPWADSHSFRNWAYGRKTPWVSDSKTPLSFS